MRALLLHAPQANRQGFGVGSRLCLNVYVREHQEMILNLGPEESSV
jgi:hypothetical protein